MAVCGGDAANEETREHVEMYRGLLRTLLMNKRTITAEKKRLLREVRRENGVPDAVHTALLGKFGWSEDEYEDGERAAPAEDDADLPEERAALASPDGFALVWLEKGHLSASSSGSCSSGSSGSSSEADKARENVFGRVCMRFFQTMAKAQGNFTVDAVGVVANARLRARYAALRAEYAAQGKDGEQWGFHGTGAAAVAAIVRTGFLAPGEIRAANRGRARRSKIRVLDSGFFGSGIYFSDYSDYAMFYSDTRGSNEILLCQLLPGRAYRCTARMDGRSNMPGYDSHISPGGNEIVIFNPAACLPRYIIRFSYQPDSSRQQES